eukprot:COSAG03_NODE_1188_length_4617_cov_2.586985_1_plen_64_part_10
MIGDSHTVNIIFRFGGCTGDGSVVASSSQEKPFFHATIGSRMFIVTILFCPFDTKVCVRVMSWM